MGKFSLGVGLLAVLLALGLWTGHAVDRLHGPVSRCLEQAAQAAVREDAQMSYALMEQAKAAWDACRDGIAAVADHAPMDEIESLFAQLENLRRQGQLSGFGALCAKLSRLVQAMAEAHQLSWWNILCLRISPK